MHHHGVIMDAVAQLEARVARLQASVAQTVAPNVVAAIALFEDKPLRSEAHVEKFTVLTL